jgi:hypothetical protein
LGQNEKHFKIVNNFLKGITWKDGVWAALAAILIFLNVRSCNSKTELTSLTSSSCDTIRITNIDSFIEWREVPIPVPVIDTIKVEVRVDRIVEINRVDTFTLIEPTFVYMLEDRKLFVYDSIMETANYKLRWHIESFGELKAFYHALNFKLEVRETNNIITQSEDSRKWLLMFEGLAQTDFSTETAYYLGGSLHRSLGKKNILFVGGGYYRQLGDVQRKSNIVKASLGLRF